MSNYNPVEEKIIMTMNSLHERIADSSDSAWTHQIKKDIGKLGIEEGWGICAGGMKNEGFEAEWLYDLVWFESNKNNELLDVGLVLESEWNKSFDQVKYDFEKLLLSKSKYKVMVFQNGEKATEEIFNILERILNNCRLAETPERYLLFGYNNQDDSFHIKHIII